MGIRDSKDDCVGGTMTLPDGYFVHEVNFDAEEPYCILHNKDFLKHEEPIKVLIPRSLAYYVTTHFCGSESMHKNIRAEAIHEYRNKIKDAINWDGKPPF